jgi:hypothetical protein
MKKLVMLFLLLFFGFYLWTGCDGEKNSSDETEQEKCIVNGKTYEIGERFTVWCNICICTEEGAGCDEDACSCSSGSKEMFPCNDEGDIVVEWCECLNPMEGYSCIEDPMSQCE